LPLISAPIIVFLALHKKELFQQKTIAKIFFVLIFAIQIFQITNYYYNIKFSFITAIRDVAETIQKQDEENQVVLGDLSTSMIFDAKVKAVSLTPIEQLVPKIMKNRPRYLLLQDNKKLEILKTVFPSYFNNIVLLKKYEIFDNYYNGDFTYFYFIQTSN